MFSGYMPEKLDIGLLGHDSTFRMTNNCLLHKD